MPRHRRNSRRWPVILNALSRSAVQTKFFAPIYGAPFVRDLEGGRRYATIADFEKLVKLTYMHPNLHHGGLVIAEPTDVPVSKRHLDMLFAHMTLSDKPHLGAITAKERAQDSVDMIEILFGTETLENNVCVMANVNTNSPLLVDKVASEAIQVYSSRGQAMVVTPFILTGAMGPVSTAASVAQAMAEAMICCAFAQLVRPGAPFVMGNFLSSMSLKIRRADLWHARTSAFKLCDWPVGATSRFTAALRRIFDGFQDRRRAGGLRKCGLDALHGAGQARTSPCTPPDGWKAGWQPGSKS